MPLLLALAATACFATALLGYRLLKLSPLTLDMSRGHLASDIIINARQQPVVTDYDIRLAPTPMGTLLAGWGVAESGTTGVVKARIKLRGEMDPDLMYGCGGDRPFLRRHHMTLPQFLQLVWDKGDDDRAIVDAVKQAAGIR